MKKLFLLLLLIVTMSVSAKPYVFTINSFSCYENNVWSTPKDYSCKLVIDLTDQKMTVYNDSIWSYRILKSEPVVKYDKYTKMDYKCIDNEDVYCRVVVLIYKEGECTFTIHYSNVSILFFFD